LCWKSKRKEYRQTDAYRSWKTKYIAQEDVKKKRREWMVKDRALYPEKYKTISKRKSIKARESGWNKIYSKKRRSIPKNYLDHIMGNALRKALRNKSGSWKSLVGYTTDELKKHLEDKFVDGMDWDLFVKGKIHIDHIIPKSHFKYQKYTDEEFIMCWSLDNLQPLWAKDNLKKGAKILGSVS
jgi:hypothetical protein